MLEAYNYFKLHFPMESMHTVSCFVELYEYIKESSMNDLLDIGEFGTLLHEQIQHVGIESETDNYTIVVMQREV